MIKTEHRAYSILMLRNAIKELLKDDGLYDEQAIQYIMSAKGELTDNMDWTMSKFKVYGTKKNVTIEACNVKEAKKQGVWKILQIDDLDPCF